MFKSTFKACKFGIEKLGLLKDVKAVKVWKIVLQFWAFGIRVSTMISATPFFHLERTNVFSTAIQKYFFLKIFFSKPQKIYWNWEAIFSLQKVNFSTSIKIN